MRSSTLEKLARMLEALNSPDPRERRRAEKSLLFAIRYGRGK